MWNYNANLSINLVVNQDAFSNIFFSYLLRCSLVYYTQPHVREVTSHELIRFVKHDKNILVCASVRTCDDPLESLMCSIFYPIIQFHEHAQIQKFLPDNVFFYLV